MLLSCRRHSRRDLPRARFAWLDARADDPHDTAWGVFFSALRIPAEYRLEHLRLAIVWQDDMPDVLCREVGWHWLPSLGAAWMVLPETGSTEWPLVRALARHLGLPLYVATMPPGAHPAHGGCRYCLPLPPHYRGHYLVFPAHEVDIAFPDDLDLAWRWCPQCGPTCAGVSDSCACGALPEPASFHNTRMCFAGQAVKLALKEFVAARGPSILHQSWQELLLPHLQAAGADK